MSQPASTERRAFVVSKPRADIYTVLLSVSLVSILIAIALLAMEMGRYNWQTKPTGFVDRPAMTALAALDAPRHVAAVLS